MPLISVLMTAFNREMYIGEAIQSVLDSSFTEFELIIVDDCSSDNTFQIAESYAATDERVRVFLNDRNLGDYKNRNKAASYARGKYLKYLDADDIIYKHTLLAMYSAMELWPLAAYGFSFSGNTTDTTRFPLRYTPREAYFAHYCGSGFFYAGPGGSIIRKDCFEKVGGFAEARHISDTDLWLRLSTEHDCILLWPNLIWWRIHDSQESKIELANISVIAARHKLSINNLSSENPLTEKERRKAINNFRRIYARRIYLLILSGNFRKAGALYKEDRLSLQTLLLALLPINRLYRLFSF